MKQYLKETKSWLRAVIPAPSIVRLVAVLAVMASMASVLAESARADVAVQPIVLVADVEGVINPLSSQYVSRALATAQREGAETLVIRIDTPGGLDSAMREITRDLLNSPVPVVVYVAPPGARAASAGMFITLAANIAAMAPGTNIGAAHPVALGGEADPAAMDKVVSDAAATARAIAKTRGRNAEWAEQAVRESVSITADEALDLGVIDLVARDLEDLIEQLDGQSVTTALGPTSLSTLDASVRTIPMNIAERLLHVITNPDIAYLLLTIGTIGIIAELYSPGTLFPGIIGVISLLLAFLALGTLPTNWVGVALLVIALAMVVIDLNTEGFGALGIVAIGVFVLSSLMLFAPILPVSPASPEVQVSPLLIFVVTGAIIVLLLVVMGALVSARRIPVATGPERLVGATGTAVTDLTPGGQVRIDSEVWSAIAESPPIPAGQSIKVVGVRGVTLRVAPASTTVLP